MGLLLAVAVGLRLAAALVAPLLPELVVLSGLAAALWIVLGRPGRL